MAIRDRVVWGRGNPFGDPRLASLPWLVREFRLGRMPIGWRGNKTWENRWLDLPVNVSDYYREYYVGTSAESGSLRIVLGERGECYVSGNHHQDWRQVVGMPILPATDNVDLVFSGQRAVDRRRIDGALLMIGSGKSWKACSGSKRLEPLPFGLYLCKNFRDRSDVAMVSNGIGFSVDLEPMFPTNRTLLRIHPDGNLPGTQGCIGITDADMYGCYTALKRLLKSKRSARLNVSSG